MDEPERRLMDRIVIRELEVFYRVGVTDAERAAPQRLLLDLEIALDLAPAAETDELQETIDYFALTRRLLAFGNERSWKLIEKLAADVARLVLEDPRVVGVEVEVRKFVVPEARWVAVRMSRARASA
jgi:dihydroneopterin aldolase